MRKGVLESEFTEEIVRISDDRSHSGRDVGEKVTILEDELMGFVKSVNVLRCRGSNSNWRINQDGLMLKSKSVYKSVTEEWSEGRFGYTVREANISWGKTKWSTSVLQLDHSTWVLEYSLSSVIKHSSLLSLGTDVLAHMMFQAAKNVNRRVLWMFSASRIFIVEW
ncbi:uncharacterized protein LOC103848811 isoform X3 [Brassica rapa]|uniref:uncharacterized protein LOC103848811 isoform X3 n=1 Tax=Brassica campestris TaxID=3711 RepID=UPI0006AABA5B|nr:uncharacterized protein LOC103848811 isoform X3 [Brassica rapa]XP_048615425.1 uncharacterized protein LOC106411221 isoform X3 [Brassica napus]